MRTQAGTPSLTKCRAGKGEEMQIPREAVLLRIFFGENDKFDRVPLHEAIVLKAREMHLGGATVLRGHIGFGHSSRIHSNKFLRLSQDLPVVVEIVDSQEKIDAFLPVLDGMMSSGLVTIERAEVLQYGMEEARPFQVTRSSPARPSNLKI
jgi:PII-like signaling protein